VPASAQEFVRGQAMEPALQVPESRLDAVEHRDTQTYAAPKVAALVHPPPEFIDVVDALPDEDRREELDDRRNHLRTKVSGIGFSEAGMRGIGVDLDESGRT